MERIESLHDPRVAAYRSLRDRTLRGESLFVTEGRVLTRRLLRSRFGAESVFASDEFAAEMEALVPPGVPLYVASERLLLEVVGFNFHRGVLGAGRRGTPLSLDALVGPTPGATGGLPARESAAPSVAVEHGRTSGPRHPTTALVICPEVTKPENLGLIFRAAAGFGCDGVLLGQRCCDPLSRRSLRLSMGAVLEVPFVKSADLLADLGRLKSAWNVELVATVLDPQAECLAGLRWPPRVGVLFGNEADGLRAEWLALSDRRVTIPMQPAADSLNLGVAAGIVLYELKRDTLRR